MPLFEMRAPLPGVLPCLAWPRRCWMRGGGATRLQRFEQEGGTARARSPKGVAQNMIGLVMPAALPLFKPGTPTRPTWAPGTLHIKMRIRPSFAKPHATSDTFDRKLSVADMSLVPRISTNIEFGRCSSDSM